MTLIHSLLIFLISVHAASHALLVCDGGSVLGHGLALAFGTIAGVYLYPHLAFFQESRLRLQLLGGVWFLHGLLVLLTLSAVAAGDLAQVQIGLQGLLAFQVAYLMFAGGGHGYAGAHRNALVIVCLGALGGGIVAGTAVIGYGVLMIVWLVADRGLHWGFTPQQIIARATPIACAFAAAMTLLLVVFSPRPFAPPDGRPFVSAPRGGDLASAYGELAFWVLVGFGILLLLRHFLGPEGDEDAADALENLTIARSALESAPARPPAGEVDTSTWSGKIVRLYIDTIDTLERRGQRRRRDWTPRELARRLPAPALQLAEIFGRARYGPRNLSAEDYEAAHQASRTLLAAAGSDEAARETAAGDGAGL